MAEITEAEVERLAKIGAKAAAIGRNDADHWIYQGGPEAVRQRERDRRFVWAVLAAYRKD